MLPFPPDVHHAADGWALLWADLERGENVAAQLAGLREESARRARAAWTLETLSQDPTVAAIRRLFRQAGCDPTRYRPSSEALLRRVLKGEPIPSIDPLVDLNNCLSAELAVPVCVMDVRHLQPPFELRHGREGESYESLRGAFNLEGKPLLVDAAGPCDTPITGGVRVKVREDSSRVWLVAYMPADPDIAARAVAALQRIIAAAPVAAMHGVEVSG